MTYLPATIDGRDIPADAPRAQGMSDETAAAALDGAEVFRQAVLHCNCDLAGRDVIVTAANAPEGPVYFNFGDGSGELTKQITGAGESASAAHTYASDGVYLIGIRTETDRWFTEIAVNWPEPPAPLEEP